MTATRALPDDLFMVWAYDEIDSSFFEDTDEPRPLYVAMLCRDCEPEGADVIRGYDPRDGIFERPGVVVESIGGIDATHDDEYRDDIARELLAEFEARRERMIERGEN
jgi:hypothetical protein